MWCCTVQQHALFECPHTLIRIQRWVQHLPAILADAGIRRSRVIVKWGGVDILCLRPTVITYWSHPAHVGSVLDQTREGYTVWPAWLGLGPAKCVHKSRQVGG